MKKEEGKDEEDEEERKDNLRISEKKRYLHNLKPKIYAEKLGIFSTCSCDFQELLNEKNHV